MKEREEKVNEKAMGPEIREARPAFWVEYLLFLAGGYLAGVLSILTCELGSGVGAASLSGVTIAGTAMFLIRRRR